MARCGRASRSWRINGASIDSDLSGAHSSWFAPDFGPPSTFKSVPVVLSSVSCGALSCNDLPVVGAARAHVGDPWVELDEGDVRALICFRFASPLASRVRPSLSWGAVGVRVWSDLARHLIRWCARAERLHDDPNRSSYVRAELSTSVGAVCALRSADTDPRISRDLGGAYACVKT